MNKRHPLREAIVRTGAVLFLLVFIIHHVMAQIDVYRAFPTRFTIWSWANWGLVMILFLLFLVSYVIRKPAKVYAERVREYIIPLICAGVPFVIVESVLWWRMHWLPDWLRAGLKPFYVERPAIWNPYSIVLILAGNILIIWALWYLKRSFSILAEARAPVFKGPYKYFRHPMYMGEILATVGLVFLSPSVINATLTVVFVVLMVIRTRIEEEKLSGVFDKYAEYRTKTPGFLPRQ